MADENKEAPDAEEPAIFSKPLRYYGADQVDGMFADQIIVTHNTGTFTLMFYQMQVTETTEIDVVRNQPDIPAKCVAKIMLAPHLVEPFYRAIGSNLEKQKKMLEVIKVHTEKKEE